MPIVLTERQRRVLRIIVDHWSQHGAPPSLSYLGKVLGYETEASGKSAASRDFKQLRITGFLDEERRPTKKALMYEPIRCVNCGNAVFAGTLPSGDGGAE